MKTMVRKSSNEPEFQSDYIKGARMKKLKGIFLATALVATTVSGAYAQTASPAETKVLSDGVGATYKRVDNLHQTRFIEIFLAHRDAKSGKLVAECYNTLFASKGIPASRDTAPQALVEGLDFAKNEIRIWPSRCLIKRPETLNDRLERS
jgi:hypothetical protein